MGIYDAWMNHDGNLLALFENDSMVATRGLLLMMMMNACHKGVYAASLLERHGELLR